LHGTLHEPEITATSQDVRGSLATRLHGKRTGGNIMTDNDRYTDSFQRHFKENALKPRVVGKCESCENYSIVEDRTLGHEISFCTACGKKLMLYNRFRSCSKNPEHFIHSWWAFCGICGAPIAVKYDQLTRKLKNLDTITKEEISRRLNDHEVAIAIIDGVETRFEMKTGHVLATSTELLRQWQENMNARVVPRGKETRIDESIDAIYNARSSLQFIDIDPEV
jgi:hypothetical protein